MVPARVAGDGPCLRAGLLDDEVRLLAGLFLEPDGRPLGRDERRPQQRLELAVPPEVRLELLDLVGEVGAFAPDVFEARRDLVEQIVDNCSLVAADSGLRGLEVSDLDGSERHGLPFQCKRSRMFVRTAERM